MSLQPHKCLFEDPHPSPKSWTTYGDLLFSSKYTFFFPFFSPLILARPNYLFYFPKALGFASTDSPIANRQCGSMHKPWLELPAPDEHLSCRSDIMCVSPTLFVLQPFLRAWSFFPKGLCICSGSHPCFASPQTSGSEAAAASTPAPGPIASSPRPTTPLGLTQLQKHSLFVYGAHYTLEDRVENSLKGTRRPPGLSRSHSDGQLTWTA